MSQRFLSQTEDDLQRLRNMLRKVTEGDPSGLGKSLSTKNESRILDIACGECREAEMLTDFLAEMKGESAEHTVKLTGVDVRAREIADANLRFGGKSDLTTQAGTRECDFFTGDATQLNGHSELDDSFDLIFMRHQNYWNGVKTWEEIYDQALSKLDDDGRLVITSYFDIEHQLALQAIQRLGGELIQTEYNPETRELITEGKSVDRHVAIFRRR